MPKKLTTPMLTALRTLSLSEEGIDAATCAVTLTMQALERRGFAKLVVRGSWRFWVITAAGRSALETAERTAELAGAKQAVRKLEGAIQAAVTLNRPKSSRFIRGKIVCRRAQGKVFEPYISGVSPIGIGVGKFFPVSRGGKEFHGLLILPRREAPQEDQGQHKETHSDEARGATVVHGVQPGNRAHGKRQADYNGKEQKLYQSRTEKKQRYKKRS